MPLSYFRNHLRRILGIPEIQTELGNLVTTTSEQAIEQKRNAAWLKEAATQIAAIRQSLAEQSNLDARTAVWMKEVATQLATLRQTMAANSDLNQVKSEIGRLVSSVDGNSAASASREGRTAAWTKETAKQIALIRETIAASSEQLATIRQTMAASSDLNQVKSEVGRLVSSVDGNSAALASRESRTASWTKETAKQIALIRETIAASSLADDNLLLTLEEFRKGDGPIIVGPWLSEVGFELLYWIPFLQWFVEEFAIDRSRIVAVSRGGVSSWYTNVAERYYEIFDRHSVEDFRAANELRMSMQSGSIKQYTPLIFDSKVIELVKRELQLPDAKILHPSLMYLYFKPYWEGLKSQRDLLSRLRFLRIPPITDPIVERLPSKFISAKFYSRPGSNPAPEDAASLFRFLSRAALSIPIVSMDSLLVFDEHEAFRLDDISNTIHVGEWMEPATNLRVQTAIVSKAEALIGTYGGFTYLPLLLGRPSIGIVSGESNRLSVHANVMYRMAEVLNGSVTALHARALDLSSGLISLCEGHEHQRR
jgi:hypothetical protein